MSTNTNFQQIIQQATTNLRIDRHALDDMIEVHPILYNNVLSAHAEACSIRDELKNSLETTFANLSLAFRQAAGKSGAKVTEDQIKQTVYADPIYQQIQNELVAAKWECDQLAGLKEAFSSRGHMLRDLVALWVGGYFTSNSISVTDAALQNARYGMARQAITKKRLPSSGGAE